MRALSEEVQWCNQGATREIKLCTLRGCPCLQQKRAEKVNQ